MDLLKRLHDPQLVADFQKFMGVEVVPVNEGTSNGEAPVESKNGRTYNLRSRSTDSPNHRNGPMSTEKPEGEPKETKNGHMKYKIHVKFWYYLFHFGAGLGNEFFYCIFFPTWFWNIDGYVCRRVILVWSFLMYVGQATKDVVRWDRPNSPPVVRLEKRYELEYGMPSTHAMVGVAIPFTLLHYTHGRYEYSYVVGVVIALIWCATVCTSRLYLGMHSVMDVICGMLFSAFLLAIWMPYLDIIDHFQLTHPYAPAVCILLPLFLSIFYPTLDKWSTARGDTTLVIAVGAGVAVGHWLNYSWGLLSRSSQPLPYQIIEPDMRYLWQAVVRTAIGLLILFSTRLAMKLSMYNLICYVCGFDKKDIKARQKLVVELPYKFITYIVISLNVVCLAPYIFRQLGIERVTSFTEM